MQSVRKWLGTPGAQAMYDQAPTQFWQHYNDLADPKQPKPEYRQVGDRLLSIGPDGKPRVIYSAPQGGGGFHMMTPDEVKAAGLPDGTSAQIGPDGQVHILNKGSDGVELSDAAAHMLAAAGQQGYKIPIPSLGMKSGGARTKYLNTLADEVKASGADWPTAVRNMVYGEAGIFGTKQMQKTYGATLLNERSAMKQADIALDVSNKFPRGEVQSLNQWWTTGKKQFGSSEAQQYANAINTFAEEYAKVMSGSSGSQASTDSARKTAHEMISTGLSNGQMADTIALMKREMRARTQAQLDAMQEQVKGLRDFGGDASESGDAGNVDDLLSKYGVK